MSLHRYGHPSVGKDVTMTEDRHGLEPFELAYPGPLRDQLVAGW